MQEYELAIVLHPDLEIDQAKPLGKIEKLIQSAEGKIVARDDWGKRKLAYPINKQQFGLYFFYQLELPTAALGELEHNLAITNEVLRHMIVKLLPLPEPAPPKAETQKATSAAADEKKPMAKTDIEPLTEAPVSPRRTAEKLASKSTAKVTDNVKGE